MASLSTFRLGGSVLRRTQVNRSYSIFSEFVKKVKSGVESDPELKKSVEALKETTDSVKERTKAAGEHVQKAAAAAQTVTQQLTKQAVQVSSAVQETISQASKTLREKVQTPPSAAQQEAGVSDEAPTTTQGERQQEAATSKDTATPSSTPHPSSSTEEHKDGNADNETTNQSTSGDGGCKPMGADTGTLISRVKGLASVVYKEVKDVVFPKEELASALRATAVPAQDTPVASSGATSLAVVERKENAWQKQWRQVKEKLGEHPLFRRLGTLGEHKVFEKGREVAEDIKERWETSDSPLVHKIQDMQDSLFAETEAARALREIRNRDSSFDMVTFLRRLKADVPSVIKGYLTGDEEQLKQHCSSDMVERLMGIVKAMQAQGLYSDSTILDTSDVELVDMKFLEDEPIVVVQFNCQQINCSRDKFGNVVDGAPDSVHRVYYYWALQQDSSAFVGTDGKHYPPRWGLKEMLVRGMHNLL